ncbi:MAG: cytochrome bc complex cytochrome b subunit, partial [Thermoproteota archaeon]
IILIVFAGFFHLYRYALNQAKNTPPPPPIHEDKPKELAESPVPNSKLSDQSSSTVTKEIAQQITAPKIQADLGVGTNKISDFGSSDLKTP